MAGGSGTRMWPMSRTAYPKQFLKLNDPNLTMLQETLSRLDRLSINSLEMGEVELAKSTIITNEEHRFLAAENLRQLEQSADIILEPVGRNTAPAIALAALSALGDNNNDEDPVLLVLAADHVIEDVEAFHRSIQDAYLLAEQGKLVTFGIVPTEPATGYGYIRRGAPVTNEERSDFRESQRACFINQFVEKPDLTTAKQYIESGEYLWNSGMFMFKAQSYLDVLNRYRPDIYMACVKAMQSTSKDFDFIRVDKAAFEVCPDDSIDYAVMEPLSQSSSEEAVVILLDAGWSDVGSWSALWEIKDKDLQENVLEGDVISHNSTNNYVIAKDRLVATVGVDDLVIVDTKDALLVASKDQVQDVKAIVADLKKRERGEYIQHREVFRPWGKYDSIDNGGRYQVKHITVNPGAKLSVQMHHHRAEHWIVVSGTAKVTNGEKTYLVSENESTYIPIGQLHALENPGVIPLEMIEVQSGTYLGEDDIVRFEDRYGRAEGAE